MKKVCHITTVHPRDDLRILNKQLKSLVNSNFETTLIVADGRKNENLEGIKIVDIGQPKNRLTRLLKSGVAAFFMAKSIDADIYQIHDPELLPVAYFLKKNGKKVIYDSHEDLPRQVLTKPYLPFWSKKGISIVLELLEDFFSKSLSGILCATPHIKERFEKINSNCLEILNYPISRNLPEKSRSAKFEYDLVYIGHISRLRGFDTIKFLAQNSDLKIALAGVFSPDFLQNEIVNIPAIKYLGYLNKEKVIDLLNVSRLGFVVLHPTESYITSYPIKMFEYFQAGLPVVASDFPIWREIIDNDNLGICVNPLDCKSILNSIISLLNDSETLEKMSSNGKRVILDKYNWSIEEKKLVEFYINL
jgi:glycosyltransferase involved in cell wall biosynthesis